MNRESRGTMNKYARKKKIWQLEKREDVAGGRWRELQEEPEWKVERAVAFQSNAVRVARLWAPLRGRNKIKLKMNMSIQPKFQRTSVS